MHRSVPSLLVEVRLPMKSLFCVETPMPRAHAHNKSPQPGLQPVPSGREESRPERCQRLAASNYGEKDKLPACVIWVPCPSRLKLTGLPVCPQLSIGSKSITAWDDDRHREVQRSSRQGSSLGRWHPERPVLHLVCSVCMRLSLAVRWLFGPQWISIHPAEVSATYSGRGR